MVTMLDIFHNFVHLLGAGHLKTKLDKQKHFVCIYTYIFVFIPLTGIYASINKTTAVWVVCLELQCYPRFMLVKIFFFLYIKKETPMEKRKEKSLRKNFKLFKIITFPLHLKIKMADVIPSHW